MLAAIGVAQVAVWRKPVVAILSTGDEIIAPGESMQPARVYDSNAQVLADAVRELPDRVGSVPWWLDRMLVNHPVPSIRERQREDRDDPCARAQREGCDGGSGRGAAPEEIDHDGVGVNVLIDQHRHPAV